MHVTSWLVRVYIMYQDWSMCTVIEECWEMCRIIISMDPLSKWEATRARDGSGVSRHIMRLGYRKSSMQREVQNTCVIPMCEYFTSQEASLHELILRLCLHWPILTIHSLTGSTFRHHKKVDLFMVVKMVMA